MLLAEAAHETVHGVAEEVLRPVVVVDNQEGMAESTRCQAAEAEAGSPGWL